MIRLLMIFLFFAIGCGTASATQESDFQHRALECTNFASVFESAAQYRNGGSSPHQAYEYLSFWLQNGFNAEELTGIINQVYFGKGFEQAGGPAFRRQMFAYCMNRTNPNYKPFEPLK